ncbi:MAG: CARDB domain-containing protein [Caldilineaceae bacterium]
MRRAPHETPNQQKLAARAGGRYGRIGPAPRACARGQRPIPPESDNALNAAPDLVVTEIRFLPPEFGAGDEVDITPVVKNQGGADAAVIKLYLYVEPEQDPPTSETTVDGQTTFGLGLAAEDVRRLARTSFPITQDNPQICVLVDPDNQVAESNEDNNLFCVKSPPAQAPAGRLRR